MLSALYVQQIPFVIVIHTNVNNVYHHMLCLIINVYQFVLMVFSLNQLISIEAFSFAMFVKNVPLVLSAIKKLILVVLVPTDAVNALKLQPLVNLLVLQENTGTTSTVLKFVHQIPILTVTMMPFKSVVL